MTCLYLYKSKPHKHGGPSGIPSRATCFGAGADDKKAVNNVCSAGRYLSLPVAPCGLCNKENRALQKNFCRACHVWPVSALHVQRHRAANCLINTSQFKGQFIRPWITAGCAWIAPEELQLNSIWSSKECQCLSLEEVLVAVFLMSWRSRG